MVRTPITREHRTCATSSDIFRHAKHGFSQKLTSVVLYTTSQAEPQPCQRKEVVALSLPRCLHALDQEGDCKLLGLRHSAAYLSTSTRMAVNLHPVDPTTHSDLHAHKCWTLRSMWVPGGLALSCPCRFLGPMFSS